MKLGVREICDVVLKAKSDITLGTHTFHAGEPVIYFDTAKTSSLETAATTVYAQGGAGNARLLAWEGEKTVTFTLEDALISPKSLAILSGAGLIQATSDTPIVAHATQTVVMTDATTAKFEMPEAKAGENEVSLATDQPAYAMLLDNNGEMSGVPVKVALTVADGVVTIAAGTEGGKLPVFKAGDVLLLDYYVTYLSDAQQIDITADKFAGYYYLEASTLFRRQSDGKDLPAEFIVPKVKIQSNFTFTMAATGDPSSFTFTMDAMPDYTVYDKTNKVLATIQILNADDNYDLADVASEDEGEVQRINYNVNTSGRYLGRKATTNDTPEVAGE